MGGRGLSGLGRRNGDHGLTRFTEEQTIAIQRGIGFGTPFGMEHDDWGDIIVRGFQAHEGRRVEVARFGRIAPACECPRAPRNGDIVDVWVSPRPLGGGPEAPATDYDVVVIGSGFGGSVSALRLTEKGYRVGVLESGRRFADSELPKTSWRVKDYLLAPELGCFGIQRIHRLNDVIVLAGAGVGRRVAGLRQHPLRPR